MAPAMRDLDLLHNASPHCAEGVHRNVGTNTPFPGQPAFLSTFLLGQKVVRDSLRYGTPMKTLPLTPARLVFSSVAALGNLVRYASN